MCFLLALLVQRWHMTFVKQASSELQLGLIATSVSSTVATDANQSQCEVCAALTLDVWLCMCFSFQEQNSALALENESQREQYERCLDEVRPSLSCLTSKHTQGRLARCFTYLEKSASVCVEFHFMWTELSSWRLRLMRFSKAHCISHRLAICLNHILRQEEVKCWY